MTEQTTDEGYLQLIEEGINFPYIQQTFKMNKE